MNSRDVAYHVNGVAVSLWKRVAASKTFWVAAAFVLAAADKWNHGELSSAEFFQIVQIGVIGILIRAALGRAELAANAGNPELPAVTAHEKPAPGVPPIVSGITTCVLATGSLLLLRQ